MTNDPNLLDLIEKAIAQAAGPHGGEVKIATQKVIDAIDRAGYELKPKKIAK